MKTGRSKTPSRERARGREKMVMGKMEMDVITGVNPRTRAWARARAAFFGPTIENETDAAVDYALEQTHGSRGYRSLWRFYCQAIGINTFLDQLHDVLSCHGKGEIKTPARAFHARIREMKAQFDRMEGGVK